MAAAAANHQLPCDGEGKCMLCGNKPPEAETLTCKTCVTPWHVECLAVPPQSLASTLQWECPDCDESAAPVAGEAKSGAAGAGAGDGSLVASIKAIEADSSLTEQEKARRRQDLMGGGKSGSGDGDDDEAKEEAKDDNDILSILGENMKCSFCMLLPDRPVTTPCGHNFCLKCFEKWVKQGKKTCAKCRLSIPAKMLSQPRINASLVFAIRMARKPSAGQPNGPRIIHFVQDEERPDKAFTTDRAKKTGNANAKSGRIFVTIPGDHLGPILAENDPVKKTGVLVGDSWTDRLACRQWGAHFPHVSGIAGQSGYGAQSVVLSGGYEDDQDNGEWFLYTGSGGRDLSGNKRTNKLQSSDQKFTKANEALRLSCKKGYPVRVVRSHKEKRSNYAPEEGVRYDGIYRIEKCWRSNGNQGFKVCRYLFVRCDNSPAPWTGDEHGDRPRPLPVVPELKNAADITERKESPFWDFDANDACWKWMKPQPASCVYKKANGTKGVRKSSNKSDEEKILKEFSCLLCRKVMNLPVTTPCAHNFCKACLEGVFSGQTFERERNRGGRSLRTQKNVMKCPCCTTDLSEFLQNVQVNRELMGTIELLQRKIEDDKDSAASEEENKIEDEKDSAASEDEISDETDDNEKEEEEEAEPELEPEHVITIPIETNEKAAIKKKLEEDENSEPVPEIINEAADKETIEEEEKVEPEPKAKPAESKGAAAKRKRGAVAVSQGVRKSPRAKKCAPSIPEEVAEPEPEPEATPTGTKGKAAGKKRGAAAVAGAQGVRKSPRRMRSGSPSSPLHLRSNGF